MSLKQKGIRLTSPFVNFSYTESLDGGNDANNQSNDDDQDGSVDNVDDSQGGYGGPRND